MDPKVQAIIKEAILKCVKPPTPSLKIPLFGQILDAGFSTANFGAVWLEMVNKIAAAHNVTIIGNSAMMVSTLAAGVSGYFARRLPTELREGMTNMGLMSEGLSDVNELLTSSIGASKETVNYLNAYSTYVFGKKLDETLSSGSDSRLNIDVLQSIAKYVQSIPSREDITEFEAFSGLSAKDFR